MWIIAITQWQSTVPLPVVIYTDNGPPIIQLMNERATTATRATLTRVLLSAHGSSGANHHRQGHEHRPGELPGNYEVFKSLYTRAPRPRLQLSL
jgi:hypothetical protein